jgi:ankyrin repeat protein
LALAGQLGHTEVVRLLLEAGENPSRYNPEGLHSHATPLHHAALAGHLEVVRLLVESGADATLPDLLWKADPAGWAEHGGHPEVARYLREQCPC